MHSRLLIAALVLVGVVAAAAPQATSRTAGSPKIYLRIAGYRASVDLSPAGTLLNDACSTYCGFSFPPGTTTVRLTAHPAPGSSFVGWVQAFNGWTPSCTGNARTCYINLRTSVAIKAAFNPVSLSWHSSSGGGTVESSMHDRLVASRAAYTTTTQARTSLHTQTRDTPFPRGATLAAPTDHAGCA